ncbi:segregation/condensation protein A [Candidatus Giovannonibacteria bacterium]|nr:segregation/condensation protein A [Candidatus Giovannonibacteria bacterium]
MYEISLEKFSGPLDLLLNLVQEEKLSINEISLAKVAEQYISYLKTLEDMPKEELASFLVVASTLILIKSRSLIPNLELSVEEKIDISELERRLKTYEFFKKLSEHIKTLNQKKRHLFGREAYLGMQSVFFPPEGILAHDLKNILEELIITLPQKESLPEDIIEKAVSIEEKINELKSRLESALELSFQDIRGGKKEKVEVIVSFLAVLELVKQGFLILDQKETFGNIKLKKNE